MIYIEDMHSRIDSILPLNYMFNKPKMHQHYKVELCIYKW